MTYVIKCKGYEVECESPEEMRAIVEWTDPTLAMFRWALDPVNRRRAVALALERAGGTSFNSANFANACADLSKIDLVLGDADVRAILEQDPSLRMDRRTRCDWRLAPNSGDEPSREDLLLERDVLTGRIIDLQTELQRVRSKFEDTALPWEGG